ncbi:MAG: hypothetical protein M5R40_22070 [Anaerolineae bacterium]|nr:hypothetical protein [Anaerolineae bacterium]
MYAVSEGQRQRLFTIVMLFVVVTTLPCYCLGLYLIASWPGDEPTPTPRPNRDHDNPPTGRHHHPDADPLAVAYPAAGDDVLRPAAGDLFRPRR